MKKTIRLTESDLIRIVKKVIKEQSDSPTLQGCLSKTPSELKPIVQGLYNASNELDYRAFSNWDEDTIVNLILKIKNKQQYYLVNKSLECFYDIRRMDGLHPAETGQMVGFDFIKDIIDESIMNSTLSTMIGDEYELYQNLIDHFIDNKLIDRSSKFCKDKKYFDNYQGNIIESLCTGKPPRF